ncbi:MAG: sterol desaturase family protein [Pseudomonadota bacterium]
MIDWIAQADRIRLVAFLVAIVAFALWEALRPRRDVTDRKRRWTGNFGLFLSGAMLVRLLIPVLPVAFAVWCETNGIGLFNTVTLSRWLAIPLAVVALDLAIYWQHRWMHAIPMLWRLHRVHHADTEFDVTTAIRFHPLEIALSLGYKMVIIAALGANALAVVIFEIVLNVSAMFNHANISLSPAVDRRLRRLLVTPDFHRVHHSADQRETDMNYGFCLTLWDYLFRSYKSQPEKSHQSMTIGLEYFREPNEHRLPALLTQPFRSAAQNKESGVQ